MRFAFLVALGVFYSFPIAANGSPIAYLLGNNGTIYNFNADGTMTSFVTGQGGVAMIGDSAGNLYVNNPGFSISMITPSGAVSVYSHDMSGGSLIHGPNEFAWDTSGNLYNGSPANGTVAVTMPASGQPTLFESGLNFPSGIAVSKSGIVYVSAEQRGYIAEINGGTISTLATGPDGELAMGADGNIYSAENGAIDKVTPAGVVSIYASVPGDTFNDLSFDSSGDIWATDQYYNLVEITPSLSVFTFPTQAGVPLTAVVAVPEPAPVAGLAIATCGFLLSRRKRGTVRRDAFELR